jgi:hypothetical protein
LASSIHLAAICFIFSYFLCRLDISAHNWLKIIVSSLFIGVFFPLGQFIKRLPTIELLERIQTYSNWDGYSSSLGVFSNITVLKSIFISLCCLYNYERLKSNYAFKVLLDIYLLSLCWLILFNDFSIIAARIATFFSIGEVILCASFYTLFDKKNKYIYAFILYGFALLMLSLHVFTNKLFEYKMI